MGDTLENMANLRGLGAVIGILGMVGVFVATIDDHWMQSVDLPGTTMNTFEMHQGLWLKCQTTNNQQMCSDYAGGITNLPPALIAQRAMMIMACALGTIATIGAVCSTDAVNAVKTARGKKQVCCLAAVLFLATSVLVVATASWACKNIVVDHQLEPGDFFNPGHFNQVTYTLGMDIYIAWAAGFLVLIATVALFFSGCNTDDEDDDEYDNTYNMNDTTSYQPGKSHV